MAWSHKVVVGVEEDGFAVIFFETGLRTGQRIYFY